MKIAHFAMFAPCRTGLYETTYDMIKAERMAGHTADFVDIGIDGKRHVGSTDNRRGCLLKVLDYDDVKDYDLFVSNCNIPSGFLSETSAPVIQIMHGRPLCSFRLQQTNKKKFPVYDIYSNAAHNTRYKGFVSLWPENLPYWRAVVPENKLYTTKHPPCDIDTFVPAGTKYRFRNMSKKKFNILIADMWREDHDPFEVASGIADLARHRKDFNVHFYAVQTPMGPWKYVFAHLKKLGVLGEIKGVMYNIDRVFRAVDLVITIHINATRIMRESFACGTPVIGPTGNHYALRHFDSRNPGDVAAAINEVLDDIEESPDNLRAQARGISRAFDLKTFGPEITGIYERILNGSSKHSNRVGSKAVHA